MRLLTATIATDKVNLHPTGSEASSTYFTEDGITFVLQITRPIGGHSRAHLKTLSQSNADAHTFHFNPERTPTENKQSLAEWIVFVVDMTLVIRQLTNA